MNGVNIVASDDVAHHLADKVATLWQCRIEIRLTAILHKPLGVFVIDVIGRQAFNFAFGVSHAIRIEPSVQLHAAIVALGNHKLQRVPIGIRRFAKFAGQIHTPGFKVRGIEGIGFRTHLP